ncbi:MAG: pentapeptide repeat-containing protein [Pseudomonadota bacterium]
MLIPIAVTIAICYYFFRHINYLNSVQTLLQVTERLDQGNKTFGLIFQAYLALGAFLTVYYTWRRIKLLEVQVLAIEDGQITDRYTKAIEQLGNEANITVRIGGIFALERIAKDSVKRCDHRDYNTVMEVLTGYIHIKSPLHIPLIECGEVSEYYTRGHITDDIQAALSVITRRELSYEHGENQKLDLSKCNLNSANLKGANLNGANLKESNLEDANMQSTRLEECNLECCILNNAKLQEAILIRANIKSTKLREADLQGANLLWANLTDAKLQKAKLQHAELSHADLQKAKLQEAQLQNSILRFAMLQGANLKEANLTKAKLQG